MFINEKKMHVPKTGQIRIRILCMLINDKKVQVPKTEQM